MAMMKLKTYILNGRDNVSLGAIRKAIAEGGPVKVVVCGQPFVLVSAKELDILQAGMVLGAAVANRPADVRPIQPA